MGSAAAVRSAARSPPSTVAAAVRSWIWRAASREDTAGSTGLGEPVQLRPSLDLLGVDPGVAGGLPQHPVASLRAGLRDRECHGQHRLQLSPGHVYVLVELAHRSIPRSLVMPGLVPGLVPSWPRPDGVVVRPSGRRGVVASGARRRRR